MKFNFFDNLLPDNPEIRGRILARYNADSIQPFDLLARIGADTVGALQLLPKDAAPLGMIEEIDDFRISLAGAQEKTALLFSNDCWCQPRGTSPTTHILKLPIGKIESHSYSLDLSDSVENEFLCTQLAKEFGLPVPDCFILHINDIKALAVKRFDRRYASDGSWIMRLPQEDFVRC